MTILPNHAEGGDTKSQPTANKCAAASKSVGKTSAPESCGEDQESLDHGFSKSVASHRLSNGEKLGTSAAIVLRYLGNKVRDHGIEIDGKRWARVNLDHIASQYAYIGRSTVDDAIQRLIKAGACEAANLNNHFNKPKYDRTRCYHVPKQWRNLAEEEIRYFDPSLAAGIGIPAAAIYHNFCHWITVRQTDGDPEEVQLAPAILADLLPFNRSTIKRAIDRLKGAEMIVPIISAQCCFAKGGRPPPGSKPDETGSKPDKGGSKPDESGSKPDNDSINSILADALTESSKTEAAPRSSNSSSRVEEAEQSSDISVEQCAALEADEQARVRQEENQSPSSDQLDLGHSWEELHKRNRAFSEWDKLWEKHSEPFVNQIVTCGKSFLKRLTTEQWDDLLATPDPELLFENLRPLFLSFWGTRLDSVSFVNQLVFSEGLLACLIGAFLIARDRHSFEHQSAFLHRACYLLSLDIGEFQSQWRDKAIRAEFTELRVLHASIFDGHFNRLDLVIDSDNQAVSIQLVDERPKSASGYFEDGDWLTYNFIGYRVKAMSYMKVQYDINELRRANPAYTGTAPVRMDWQSLRVSSGAVPSTLRRVNSLLKDRENKPAEECQWYVPKPLAELIMHCISKAQR